MRMKMSCRTKKLLENQTIWWWWVWRKPERRRPTESNRKRRSLAGFACERRRARRGQVRSELDSNLNRIWTQVGIEYLNSSLNWIWIWTELNLHYLTTIDALKIKEVESLTSLQLVYGWPWFCFAGDPNLKGLVAMDSLEQRDEKWVSWMNSHALILMKPITSRIK